MKADELYKGGKRGYCFQHVIDVAGEYFTDQNDLMDSHLKGRLISSMANKGIFIVSELGEDANWMNYSLRKSNSKKRHIYSLMFRVPQSPEYPDHGLAYNSPGIVEITRLPFNRETNKKLSLKESSILLAHLIVLSINLGVEAIYVSDDAFHEVKDSRVAESGYLKSFGFSKDSKGESFCLNIPEFLEKISNISAIETPIPAVFPFEMVTVGS